MNNEKTELSQDSQFGIENLPENERKETQEILDSLKPEEKAEDKPETLPKEEEKKEDDQEKPEEKKEPSLIPAYKIKIAEKQWEKERLALEQKIEDLSKPKETPHVEDEGDKPKEPESKSDVDIRELADELGVDESVVDKIVKVAEARAKASNKPFELSPEDKHALVVAKQFEEKQRVELEEAIFDQSFDEKVLPEIKAEYGEDVPSSVVLYLKEKLRELSYQDGYEKVPHDLIYRGEKSFREVIAPKRKTSEPSGLGSFEVSGKTVRFEDLSTEDVEKLSDEDFDKYSDHMARRENKR